MKIQSYAVTSAAQYEYQKVEMQSLQVTQNTAQNGAAVVTNLSEWAQEMIAEARQQQNVALMNSPLDGAGGIGMPRNLPANKEDLKLQMLEDFLYALTGRRMSLRIQAGESGLQNSAALARARPARNMQRGLSITASRAEYESERVTYAAQGVVKTADGKTIHLDVGMQMSREFASFAQNKLNLAPANNTIDPLVINYGGSAASLTDEKFSFDLDSDGVMDQISFTGAGSGFLALDKNSDGSINNGSELFGPNTGNGFGELRGYDKDGNNWIDENDEIFSKLRIWSKDADGNDQLFTLLELGVGAVYLGDVSTQFDMGEGVMRSTSFFLRENGGAGTLSHIDLRV